MKHLHLLLILCPLLPAFGAEPDMPTSKTYAEIRVFDAETGRGVPMVELETVNGLVFVTTTTRCSIDLIWPRRPYAHAESNGTTTWRECR